MKNFISDSKNSINGFIISVSCGFFFSLAISSNAYGNYHGGPEFQVNTQTVSDQEYPSVATISNNNFVVVWTGQDSNLQGIYGKIFDEAGTVIDSEFSVNLDYHSNNQRYPSVSALNNGGFVAAWQSFDQDGE